MNFQFLNRSAVRRLAFLVFGCGMALQAGGALAQDPVSPPDTAFPVVTRPELSIPGSPGAGYVPHATPENEVRGGYMVESLSTEPTDFSYTDMPIVFILKTFSSRFDKNFIPSAGVTGKITLSLRKVPFDEAFQILLDKAGLVAVQRSPNVIEVMPKKDVPLSRETIPMRNRMAHDMKLTFDAMMTPQELAQMTMAVDGASNSLIVAANTEQLARIKKLANQLDVSTPQIRIKTRIVELEAGGRLSVGISWAGVLKAGNTTVRAGKDVSNLSKFDVTGITPAPQLLNSDNFGTGGFFDLSQVMDKAALYTVLNLIAEDNNTKTLSEPSIMTSNNKTALIHVGKNLPVLTTSVSQTSTVQNVSYIKEGIDLEVTPVVSLGSDQVSMRVKISVSELFGFQSNNPITTERSAFTEISIGSEKTVAIGGLVRESNTNTSNGIPVLRSIPILGALFRSKEKTHSKTDLLILLTPEIVKS